MDRIFIDMGSNNKLEFSIGKFHRKLATQLVGQLRRDGIVRGKGLNQVVGKIAGPLNLKASGLMCHSSSNRKIERSCLWFDIIAGNQRLPSGFIGILYVEDGFAKRRFDSVDFCDSHFCVIVIVLVVRGTIPKLYIIARLYQ